MIPLKQIKLCFPFFTSLRYVRLMHKVVPLCLTSSTNYKQAQYFHFSSFYHETEKVKMIGNSENNGIQQVKRKISEFNNPSRMINPFDLSTWENQTFFEEINAVKSFEQLLEIFKTNMNNVKKVKESTALSRYRIVLEICTLKLERFCVKDRQQTLQLVRSEAFTQLLAFINETVDNKNIAKIMFSKHLIGNVLMICGKLETSKELESFMATLDNFTSEYCFVYLQAYVDLIAAIQELNIHHRFHVVYDRCEIFLIDHIATIQTQNDLLFSLQKIIPNLPVKSDNPVLRKLLRKASVLIPHMDWQSIQEFIVFFHYMKFNGIKLDVGCIQAIQKHIKNKGQLHYCSVDPEKMMIACSNMGLYLPELLQMISNELHGKNYVRPMTLLKAMERLRLRDTDLLDVLHSWKWETLKNMVYVTMSAATLNYCSPALHEKLLDELPSVDLASLQEPTLAVSFVWSLCVLDVWQADVFRQILSQEFQDVLFSSIKDSSPYIERGIKTKLKFIYEYDYHRGDGKQAAPLFLEEMVTRKKMNPVTAKLIENVFSRPSQDKYLKLFHHSPRKMPIDCEMLVNDNCQLQPHSQKSDKLHRLVVQGLKYFEMTVPTSEPKPLGMAVLYKRLLELEGYKVVTIPYYELYEKTSSHQLQEHLHHEVRKVIGATDKSCPSWKHLLP